MGNWEERVDHLDRLLRLETVPVGIRVLTRPEEIPEKGKRPSDFKQKMALCQLVTLTRRYEWTTVALPEEIEACFFPLIAFGWRRVKSKEDMVAWFTKARYCRDIEVAGKRTEDFLRDRPKRGAGVIFTPLSRPAVEPEVVLIYGNPAQVMRLIRGYVNFTGLPLQSAFLGGLGCAEPLNACLNSHGAQVAVPGNGERIFGMTNDHEMAFFVPADQVDDLIGGMENEHVTGAARYPVPFYQFFTPQLPKLYQEFLKKSL